MLLHQFVSRTVTVVGERIPEIILRMIETEGLVRNALRARLEANCRGFSRGSTPHEARRYYRFDHPVASDPEDTDVQLAGERASRLRDRCSGKSIARGRVPRF